MGRAIDSELMIGMHELSCGMMDMDTSCESADNDFTYMAPNCCDNEFISIEIEDDYHNFEALNIPAEILASKKELNAIILGDTNQRSLSGWRANEIGQQLLAEL